jgi:hypothetical protein
MLNRMAEHPSTARSARSRGDQVLAFAIVWPLSSGLADGAGRVVEEVKSNITITP